MEADRLATTYNPHVQQRNQRACWMTKYRQLKEEVTKKTLASWCWGNECHELEKTCSWSKGMGTDCVVGQGSSWIVVTKKRIDGEKKIVTSNFYYCTVCVVFFQVYGSFGLLLLLGFLILLCYVLHNCIEFTRSSCLMY